MPLRSFWVMSSGMMIAPSTSPERTSWRASSGLPTRTGSIGVEQRVGLVGEVDLRAAQLESRSVRAGTPL